MSASSTTSFGYSFASEESVLPNASRSESPLEPMSAGASEVAIEKLHDFVCVRAECGERFFALRARQFHTAMPLRLAFHVRHAFALHGMADEHGGLAVHGTRFAQCRKNAADAMAVDFRHGPAEGAPFISERLQAHDCGIRVVALHFVVVDKRAQIVEAVMHRAHRALPHFTFLQFAVAEQRVNARWTRLHFKAQRHADADGKALAQ